MINSTPSPNIFSISVESFLPSPSASLSPNSPAERTTPRPPTPDIFSRFARIKGTGRFTLDEFCALTGHPVTTALPILSQQEEAGLVLHFGSGLYLLKPAPSAPAKRKWYDWQPQTAKLQKLLSLIPENEFLKREELARLSGFSDTALTRYTRILLVGGYIVKTKINHSHAYQKSRSQLQDIPSWQQLVSRPPTIGLAISELPQKCSPAPSTVSISSTPHNPGSIAL